MPLLQLVLLVDHRDLFATELRGGQKWIPGDLRGGGSLLGLSSRSADLAVSLIMG